MCLLLLFSNACLICIVKVIRRDQEHQHLLAYCSRFSWYSVIFWRNFRSIEFPRFARIIKNTATTSEKPHRLLPSPQTHQDLPSSNSHKYLQTKVVLIRYLSSRITSSRLIRHLSAYQLHREHLVLLNLKRSLSIISIILRRYITTDIIMSHTNYPYQSAFQRFARQAPRSFWTTQPRATTNISSRVSFPRASSILSLAQMARAESQHVIRATPAFASPSNKRTFGEFARGE